MFYFTSAVVHLVHDKYLWLFTTKIFYIKIKLHIFFYRRYLNTHAFIMHLSFWFSLNLYRIKSWLLYTHIFKIPICCLFVACSQQAYIHFGVFQITPLFFFAFLKSIAMSCTKHQQMKPPSSHHQQYMLSMYKIRKLKKEIFFIYKIFVIKLSK